MTTPSLAAARPRCTFPPPGTAVTCAVSGGPDSLAMLLLAADAGLDVTAVHVDHQLRPGGEAEARIVADVARRLGASFRAASVHVADGPDLEARARAARRSVLPSDALYGHTADDQAETVLLALLRGAGVDGLAGIDPAYHPILALRRSETECIVAEAGLDPVRDPSNADLRFRRNRVRHELVPLMDAIAQRDVTALIARSAGVLRDDSTLLEELADGIDASDARALAAAPRPLARRAVRRWLRGFHAERHPPDSASVERVLAVATGEAVAAQVSGGIEVRRSGQRLSAVALTYPPEAGPMGRPRR